jgi:hypothetical protein
MRFFAVLGGALLIALLVALMLLFNRPPGSFH